MTGKIILTTIIAAVVIFFTGTVSAGQSQLSLQTACKAALKNNENIKISDETVRQAESGVDEATSYLYPQISATGSHIRNKELDPSSQALNEYELLTIEANQHIYQLGKVWAGRDLAGYNLASSKAAHQRTIREILFQVSAAYYNVLLGRKSQDIAKGALERAKKQLERAQAQFEVGVLTQNNVLRAEVQVAQARAQLERARNQYLVAREQLALETGLNQFTEKIIEPRPLSFPAISIDTLTATALKNRRDLAKVKIDAQQADRLVDWERADFFPQIFLRGTYQKTSEDELFNNNDENWSASLNLTCPFFTGGRNKAKLAKARSMSQQAALAQKRFENEIRHEVKRVYLDLQTQQKIMEENRAQVKAATKNYQQVTARFEEGLATSVDQVDAFTSLNLAENNLARAHYSYQLNLIKLQLVTGTLYRTDIK